MFSDRLQLPRRASESARTGLSSRIPFVKVQDLSRAGGALGEAQLVASSAGRGWVGVHLEEGINKCWRVDDLTVDGHYVAINLGSEPLEMRKCSQLGWGLMVVEPGAFWINPEGQPFSMRVEPWSHWAGAVVQGEYLDEVLGKHHEIRAGYGVVDKLLMHAMMMLIEAIRSPAEETSGSQALVHAFVSAFGARHGVPAAEFSQRGGIPAGQLNPLKQWVEQNIGAAITVETLARRVGLSTTHFAREFKRSTGETPWTFVVRTRLKAAAGMLKRGMAQGAVAADCGFADQAHMARVFRQHLGVTPGTVAKSG